MIQAKKYLPELSAFTMTLILLVIILIDGAINKVIRSVKELQLAKYNLEACAKEKILENGIHRKQ